MLLAKLKEAYQENVDGHVPRAPVPERLARLPRNFVQSFTKHCCTKRCLFFFFVIVSSSLFLKEQVWSKIINFHEKYIKIYCFKTSEV